MAGGRTRPLFNAAYVDNSELLTIRTNTKKSHYICTDAKLYEKLVNAVYTTGSFFNVNLSTYPQISVQINGRADKLVEHRDWLLKQIVDTLKENHAD